MPNWNFSTYKITGEKKDLKDLEKRLKRLEKRKTPRVKNGFGKLWLGCILDEFKKDWHDVQCRGEILDYDYDKINNILTMNLETAWSELPEFRHFLESVYPGMKIYHYSEEPGMGIYESNDYEHFYFPEIFRVDICGDLAEFSNKQEALDYISDRLGYQVSECNLNSDLMKYNEDNFDNDKWIYYNEVVFYKED